MHRATDYSGAVCRIGEMNMQAMNPIYPKAESPLAALFLCRDRAKAIAEQQRELLRRSHSDNHLIECKEKHHD
jgi:hypothetical protein